MSHPASLASRLHALALNDTLFPDLHHLEKAQRTRAIYRIFHTVASTAALGQEDIVDDLAPLLTLMESPCLTRQGGLCPLLASHYNLYLGTLLELGDRHHPEIIGQIEEALALHTHGLYLVTELGCGNNAMSMATEVRYDCATDGFILHTPHRHAAKFMPYIALEGQPKSSVVMARLWVGEQDCGIHPFLVPCRDTRGALCQGVSVSSPDVLDLPYFDVVDHAIITFEQVALPRWAWLRGHEHDISAGGIFHSRLASQRDIFFSSLRRVEWGKLVLTASLIPGLKLSLALAIHYAQQRPLHAHNGRVIPLMHHALHRRILTRAYVTGLAAMALYEGIKQRHLPDGRHSSRFQTDAGLVKAVAVELMRTSLQHCMQRCGAQGKFLRNRIVPTLQLCDLVGTAEGDSMPVLMKVAKDILAWPDEFLDDGTPLSQLLLRMRRQMNQQLADATDKLAAWHDLGCEAARLGWLAGNLEALRHLGSRDDIRTACREQLMLDYAPQLLHHGLCSPAEIAALPARQEATLDHVWEHHAASVPDEFDVRDLMAATPLGSPDLASAWFALAPSLHDPQPEG